VIALRPGIAEIKTKERKVYTERVDYPYGHPRNPITTEDLITKFKDCTSYSAKPLPEENLTRVIDMQKVKDARELIDLVS
jgi:2-methylcitrate dehydratase PrpD